MHGLSEFGRRLLMLLRRKQFDRDLEEEMRLHLKLREQEQRDAGLAPGAAHHAARRQFGNATLLKEVSRDMWGWHWFEHPAQDTRYGLRMLGRNPGFALVSVLTIGLGIGANSAIFSVVDGVLLRPLPCAEPDRLASVVQFSIPKGFFVAVRDRSRTMDIAAYTYDAGINLSGHGEAVRLLRSKVSVDLFQLLGVSAALGRTFRKAEDSPGSPEVVILSHALWEQRFGGDPQVIGRWIALDDVSREVVGVMPAGFSLPWSNAQLWMPIDLDPAKLWGDFEFRMVGRLHAGVTISQAQAELRALIPSVDRLMPWRMPDRWGYDAQVMPLNSYTVGDVRSKLLILLGAVGLVLLIACANVVNLLLGKAAGRRREIALRAAIGAGRWRIVRQLLTESVLVALGAAKGDVLEMVLKEGMGLAVLGVVLGLISALAASRILSGLLHGVKPYDLVTFLAVSLLMPSVALVARYIPARRAAKVDPMVALRYE